MTTFKRLLVSLASVAALACACVPLAAGAQVPSYAQPGGETIRGTVVSINGKYNISVRDERGFVDNVSLHDGTVINPTGLTLAPGERVIIAGSPNGSTFIANEIDTPYTPYAYYPIPYPVYHPYPAYSLRFGFRGR